VNPDPAFVNQSKQFWAYVRTISQHVGYTVRKSRTTVLPNAGHIKVPSPEQIRDGLEDLGLNPMYVADASGHPTPLGATLAAYFQYRADVLNTFVEPRLMLVEQAKNLFLELQDKLSPRVAIPMNTQKGEKRTPKYLTAIVNMLVEANIGGMPCDYDPHELTTVTRNGAPMRTLSRRVDGAFPQIVNPIAIWEIKEYYYTTTFGSRVADGVYETLVDGMELEELRSAEGVHVLHYLIVDDHFTWWECGRSYLCRIIDMLHMGYVDAVLFGREVEEALPGIVRQWVRIAEP
jgi:hypothetical protein